jgi:hypothetical protein
MAGVGVQHASGQWCYAQSLLGPDTIGGIIDFSYAAADHDERTLLDFVLGPIIRLLHPALPGWTDSHLSPVLTYASRFWGPHLGDSDFDDEILVSLRSFLTCQFLFWLEVLSIREEVAFTVEILQFARKYTLVSACFQKGEILLSAG